MSNTSPLYVQNASGAVAPCDLGNPAITEEQIRAYIAAGQAFTATINGSTTSGQATAIALFAAALTKTIIIYRITSGSAVAGSNCKIGKQTSDYALGPGGAVATNLDLDSANASVATLSSSTTATNSGTIFDYTLLPAFIATEILENNEVIVIPAGSTHAVAAFTTAIGSTGQTFVSVSWLEI